MHVYTPRTAAKQRLIDAAFEHFVRHGYDAASLRAIAEHVGIRKASIYTHFASKEAIFAQLLADALYLECTFVQQCFETTDAQLGPGEAYCQAFQSRYQQNISTRFLIRMAYAPPSCFIEKIQQNYEYYIQRIRQYMQHALQEYHLPQAKQRLYIDAYLGIVDSLSVELLYAGNVYRHRFDAMMMLYHSAYDALAIQTNEHSKPVHTPSPKAP
ncbi:TetR/AcrR family transcriptional regulator [Acinetobacter larvae]|uniref:HTH tetR-type domain-containing protein n=1 Tax=Acinetobacter larvae TaxID=1789224 RepID=A0A1B2M112_9GAMM|nr:TetR/AcrR family transcriptional regulator [Acinetobacter larvae]AOA58880.1 hypothetical protein BFG52_11300 [Acinetobacter larvae]